MGDFDDESIVGSVIKCSKKSGEVDRCGCGGFEVFLIIVVRICGRFLNSKCSK